MRTEWAMRVLGYLLSALERAAGLSPATFARLSSSLALFALSPVPSSLLFLLTPLLPLPSLPPSILVYSQTPYGPASVFHHAGSNITSLRLGRAILGAKYAWGDSAFGGFYLPSFAAHARKAGRGLVLGLGCGIDAGELARAGWEVQAVELVPQVAQWAGEHFGLKGVDVRVGDAWGFLEEAAKVGDTWDLVVADLFAGSATTVADFFPRMGTLKAAVAPGGCLAVNIVARPLSAGPASTLFKKHFAHVRCFTESAVRRDGQPVPLREMAASVTNLAFFLSDARISFDVPRLTDADFAAMPIRSEMLDYFPRMEIDTGKSDFGGAWDSEEARVVEGQHRAAMLEMFDRVFWEAY
ncbi:S-adenosyl-L-methionine-dependent methyltransferase [Hyaloraphidium curvatum]|nr:S-adenosyl-L-methionine-dependent methyltransferase [Hyaloraphidium curvatum]